MRFGSNTKGENGFATVSERFIKKTFRSWKRPCVKNHKALVIGDSMLRCFHKAGYKHDGFRISAYGGMELFELIALLSQGAIRDNIDFKSREERERIITGKRSLQPKFRCHKCYTNCTGKVKIGACNIES